MASEHMNRCNIGRGDNRVSGTLGHSSKNGSREKNGPIAVQSRARLGEEAVSGGVRLVPAPEAEFRVGAAGVHPRGSGWHGGGSAPILDRALKKTPPKALRESPRYSPSTLWPWLGTILTSGGNSSTSGPRESL